MDALPNLGTVAGVAAVVALIVQLVKPYLPGDPAVRLAAVVVGIVLAVGWLALVGVAQPADWLYAVLRGLEGGCAAIGIYHVANDALGGTASRKLPGG